MKAHFGGDLEPVNQQKKKEKKIVMNQKNSTKISPSELVGKGTKAFFKKIVDRLEQVYRHCSRRRFIG